MNHIHFNIPVADGIVELALIAIPIVAFFCIAGAFADRIAKDTK
ncbi:hypothetical protein LV89_03823 [Arcicella aurantiaca]|uniref:Uncharacterized protein n=1 Tax=Arcicella aurantiaca TaxID=591202 RepID=A0A316EBI4_9BACT|nr:hypothetical protein [Arcicella aurantiaca]PWK20280.1 hypothetical protein LV89_03823 [Arcicella aurantiaca]